VINLFDDLPARTDEEIFTEVLSRDGVRIERIVSTGQSTPADKPHRQGHDEWVLLLAGAAGLRIEGEAERNLRPGDHCPDRCSPVPLGDVDGQGRAHLLARHTLAPNTCPEWIATARPNPPTVLPYRSVISWQA